jgi:hypothetical protein
MAHPIANEMQNGQNTGGRQAPAAFIQNGSKSSSFEERGQISSYRAMTSH